MTNGRNLLPSDEYCPHCDNHFVLEAVTPKPALQVEGEDARVDNRYFTLFDLSLRDIYGACVLMWRKECSRMTEYAVTSSGRSSMFEIVRIAWDKWRRQVVDYDDYDMMLSTSFRHLGCKSLDNDILRETPPQRDLSINDGKRVLYCRKVASARSPVL
jgi:hypothetical protein